MEVIRFRKVLLTGGAGFVGANLAVFLRQAYPDIAVFVCDNLKRRGSELQLPRLRQFGIAFQHGDIRCREDVEAWPEFDLLIDCSAESSVQAGLTGSPLAVIENNLNGTIQCMEAVRRNNAAFLFLSTSRVYPVEPVNRLAFEERESRFAWTHAERVAGFSENGISEAFPLDGPRSVYGATKLAGELLLQEYAFSYGMPVLIDRCGLLAGPWQMGKVDQGVVTLWLARHYFGAGIRHIGFGGRGKQVRDVLHIEDFFELVVRQLGGTVGWDARPYNVGGGPQISISLQELTSLCRLVTGRSVPATSDPETSPVDMRIYLTDLTRAKTDFSWKPQRPVQSIVEDIHRWIGENEEELRPILA
jgi:CDP-paratose 2-epimerase